MSGTPSGSVQHWQARLEVALEGVGRGDTIARYFKTFKYLRHIMGPQTVVLRPGQSWKQFRLAGPFPSYSYANGPARSLLVLTTDVPGVRYSIGSEPVNQGTLSMPRLLWDFSEEIHSADFQANPTPSFDPDESASWLNYNGSNIGALGPHAMRFAKVTDQAVEIGGYCGKCPYTLADGVTAQEYGQSEARIVWGRANSKDLGNANDSIRFGFWLKTDGVYDTNGLQLVFASRPYYLDTREIDLATVDGTSDDAIYSQAIPEAAFNCYFLASMLQSAGDEGAWAWVEFDKSQFTSIKPAGVTYGADWSRITMASLYGLEVPDNADYYFGPLCMFQHAAPFRALSSAVFETIDWRQKGANQNMYDRNEATLTLTAPPDATARVSYFLGIQ